MSHADHGQRERLTCDRCHDVRGRGLPQGNRSVSLLRCSIFRIRARKIASPATSPATMGNALSARALTLMSALAATSELDFARRNNLLLAGIQERVVVQFECGTRILRVIHGRDAR